MPVLLGYSSGGGLDLCGGLNTLDFAYPKAILKFLEVLPPPCSGSSLVISDPSKI